MRKRKKSKIKKPQNKYEEYSKVDEKPIPKDFDISLEQKLEAEKSYNISRRMLKNPDGIKMSNLRNKPSNK